MSSIFEMKPKPLSDNRGSMCKSLLLNGPYSGQIDALKRKNLIHMASLGRVR